MKKYLVALDMCVHMFMSVPLPKGQWDDSLRRLSTACLPVVGLLIGLLWWGIAAVADALLPAALRSAVIAAFPFLITGFMHLDGFMDTSDAILSWRDRDEKLRILKDSHVGSFAVVMIALLFVFQYAACSETALIYGLVMIPVLSRCGSAFSVLTVSPLGHSEYNAQPEAEENGGIFAVLVMAALTVIIMLIFGGWKMLIVAAAVLAGYAVHMAYCVKTLGGVSGDLAGFCLTVSELCGLFALCFLK